MVAIVRGRQVATSELGRSPCRVAINAQMIFESERRRSNGGVVLLHFSRSAYFHRVLYVVHDKSLRDYYTHKSRRFNNQSNPWNAARSPGTELLSAMTFFEASLQRKSRAQPRNNFLLR